MLKQFATVNVIGFKNYTEAYNALKTGKICAITSDDCVRVATDESSTFAT